MFRSTLGYYFTRLQIPEICYIFYTKQDVHVQDVTYQQCFIYNGWRLIINDYSYQVRVYYAPRFGVTFDRTMRCHFVVVEHKTYPSNITWKYTTRSALQDEADQILLRKTTNLSNMATSYLYAFNYQYSYFIYDYHKLDDIRPMGRSNESTPAFKYTTQHSILDYSYSTNTIGPLNAYYALNKLEHELSTFWNWSQIYQISHYNIPDIQLDLLRTLEQKPSNLHSLHIKRKDLYLIPQHVNLSQLYLPS